MPYSTKLLTEDNDKGHIIGVDDTENGVFEIHIIEDGDSYTCDESIEKFKPYLRPMSSMTKEEERHINFEYNFFYHVGILNNIDMFEVGGSYDRDGNYNEPCTYMERRTITMPKVLEFLHWLNTHHFDYRGLIEKGLALEAKEGMYKTE